MSKIKKSEVAEWIRTLVPYLENPRILYCGDDMDIPKAYPGQLVNITGLLMKSPELISQTENLKALIELYRIAEDS